MNTVEKLDRLAELQAQREVNRLDKEQAIAKVLTPETKAKLADIEAEFATAAIDSEAATLEAEIRAFVLAVGATVKGSHLMATWNKGRVSWDTKGLDGYAVAHPELATFRKEGEPSVTLRAVR
jgi:hypothetical protein